MSREFRSEEITPSEIAKRARKTDKDLETAKTDKEKMKAMGESLDILADAALVQEAEDLTLNKIYDDEHKKLEEDLKRRAS